MGKGVRGSWETKFGDGRRNGGWGWERELGVTKQVGVHGDGRGSDGGYAKEGWVCGYAKARDGYRMEKEGREGMGEG